MDSLKGKKTFNLNIKSDLIRAEKLILATSKTQGTKGELPELTPG